MSVSIFQLWLPIILGSILAWIASAIIHVALKFHNSDYNELSNEEEVMDVLRKDNPGPKMYSVPFCTDMKKMGEEEMQAKFNKGPVAMIAVFPKGMPNMPKLLAQQIAYFVIGGVFIAYIATFTLAAGTEFMQVFRLVSAVGFLAFGWATVPFSIWYGHAWSTTAKYLVDALVYACVIAAMFAWLWPAVS